MSVMCREECVRLKGVVILYVTGFCVLEFLQCCLKVVALFSSDNIHWGRGCCLWWGCGYSCQCGCSFLKGYTVADSTEEKRMSSIGQALAEEIGNVSEQYSYVLTGYYPMGGEGGGVCRLDKEGWTQLKFHAKVFF